MGEDVWITLLLDDIKDCFNIVVGLRERGATLEKYFHDIRVALSYRLVKRRVAGFSRRVSGFSRPGRGGAACRRLVML